MESVRGKIESLLPVESGEGKNGPWTKGGVVLHIADGDYPYNVAISFWGKNYEKLKEAALTIGDDVTISVNVKSNESNGKWYTNVDGWRIEKHAASMAPTPASPMMAPPANQSSPF